MRIGIIGLAQSGKTTLFNALTQSFQDVEASSRGKREPQISTVKVPDPRLDRLHELYPTAKKVQATIEYVDIGGLARGAAQQKGFQESFLASVRNVDAVLCVLRQFDSDAVAHPEESIDPKRDWGIIAEEFLFSDLAIIENRVERLRKDLQKIKDPARQLEFDVLNRCQQSLEDETDLREVEFNEAESKAIRGFQFLTAKPILFVLNINENAVSEESEIVAKFPELERGRNRVVVALAANLEMEIAQLPDQDRKTFQDELGIAEPALNKVIRASYDLLGLIPFFTAGEKEVRAWTVTQGTRAQVAAGAIHSDIERGFIRAEVVDFDTLSRLGSLNKCKEEGVLRLEGKDYIVQNGDVITYRFNI